MSPILDKSQMTEEDIKLHFITPALTAKWTADRITMETKITDGKINLRGNLAVREKPKKADYVLYTDNKQPIAIVEAKDNHHTVSFGLQQAMTYAAMMEVPFAYSSNGDTYGKSKLDYFISVSSPYPVIATTSKLLTTGADCKMTKLIVLDQMVSSMTEFKQIIGRGTRIREAEGKAGRTFLSGRNSAD